MVGKGLMISQTKSCLNFNKLIQKTKLASYSGNAVRSFREACGHWIELALCQCFGTEIHLA